MDKALASKGTLLVIDDKSDICLLFERYFSREGYKVITALEGKTGIEKVKSERPDAIILDLIMPDMDGIETLTHIRNIAKDVVVIVITGYPSMDTALEGHYLNVYDYITKPFDMDKVKTTLEKALTKRSKH